MPKKELTIEEQITAKKCGQDGNDVYCHWLLERLNENNARKAGFCNSTLINTKNGKIYASTPMFKMNAKDNGVYMKHCPFCGTNLYSIWKKREKEAAQ